MRLVPILPTWLIVIFGGGMLAITIAAIRRARRERGPKGRAQQVGAWARRGAMATTLVAMALGPSIPQVVEETLVNAVEVYFVVDRTTSMWAEDFGGSAPRFEGVCQDMASLLEALPSSRYSIISYTSSSARELPLTADALAVDSWCAAANPEISVASIGSSLARPFTELRTALNQSATDRPDAIRLVFFMSDGEALNDTTERAAYSTLAPRISGGAVFGYGTTTGGPMRRYDGEYPRDPAAEYIVDQLNGQPAISHLEPEPLQNLASDLGVEYVERSKPGDIAGVIGAVDSRAVAAKSSRPATIDHAVIWPLAIILALLATWEAWSLAGRGFTTGQRRAARLRRREQAAAAALDDGSAPAWLGGQR